ncbi:pyridoxamine 5'-phosphate oxidase family protein [Desulfurispirillum indicum]|uniref:Pyridoxamine 5'-phosphate oxidase-related FMN-binding protein n=1 Tax=Desulfurispirillum indicum (strain ATCC BAA-1389 / DSM 22839 / S5) TaxID=653733 RepID=E6W688_DESIS|nr:pyridoxamine 5'-phosphate oxidase family protein [Desulfurispirillum indicum]ADU66124.1 pyridoxamine 5'-phosphate oxidase-related FMN-binding protein [Desulfurispirillum indicum S5]UCZ55529.1 pyridoxamine 5'-phosphate oxidase family protein [Desulfurispirillum indicum]
MDMDMKDYFAGHDGQGVLATATAEGKVNMAVYSKPFFLSATDEELAFVMARRMTFENVQANPHACYMFTEAGSQHKGCRIYLKRTEVIEDPALIAQLMEKGGYRFSAGESADSVVLVNFHVEGVVPLVTHSVAFKAD